MFTTYGLIVLVLFLGSALFNLFISYLNYSYRNHPIPKNVQDVYQEKKYEDWRHYFMDNFRFDIMKQVVNTILILILLYAEIFRFIFTQVESLSQNKDLQVLFFIGIYYMLSFVIEIIFGYYQVFHIEEKHGFNKTTKKTFWLDKLKGLILAVVLGGGLVYLISVLFSHVNSFFYVATYLVLSTILIITNLFYVKWIVPIFNKITPLEDGELKDAIVKFSTKVGYEVGKIGIIDASKRSTKLNGYFSGFGKMKQIVLYDTLKIKMTTEEIVAVLAHEIGHYKYKHILSGIARTLIILAGYLSLLYFTLNIEGFYTVFGFDQVFLGFGMILFLVLLSPMEVILGFLLNSISRKHEFQADEYSAKQYNPNAMISSLKVIARNNYSNLTPHPLYAKLTYSHPPIGDRIEALEKFLSD